MCTTIGFPYQDGIIFGRTLEVGVPLDNHIVYVPGSYKGLIQTLDGSFSSRFAMIGSGFFNLPFLGDGINEKGLMGSNNLFPGYASFAETPADGFINLTTAPAFNYLLSRCENVEEVKKEAEKLRIVAQGTSSEDTSTPQHFFFQDSKGNGLVLEPKNGELLACDNPVGVLTNAPEFPWHLTNLRNFLNLQPGNIESIDLGGTTLKKLGEGSGLTGLPGDFTPPARFVRSAFFVAATPKDLDREAAILQGFRILGQADIPTGAVTDKEAGTNDETLYTSIMDSYEKTYSLKCHDHINIQSFRLADYAEETEIRFIPLRKQMEF